MSADSVKKLKEGDEFFSFEELAHAMRNFEEQSYVCLYNRSSRTIKATKGQVPNKVFRDELKYSELDYSCIHGGKNFQSKSRGSRPNQMLVSMN